MTNYEYLYNKLETILITTNLWGCFFMSKYANDNLAKRGRFIKVFMTLVFLAIMVRLYFIQIVKQGEYKEQVNKQHILNIDDSIPRGNIFDRNGIKITNQEKQKTAFIRKQTLENNSEMKERLKDILNYNDKEMKDLLSQSDGMIEVALKEEGAIDTLSNISDVIITDKYKRYNKNNVLAHALGYVNEKDNIGISGIEKSYDREPLKVDLDFGKTPIFVDAKRNVVPGVNVDSIKDNSNISNSLQLTIDYKLQEKIEGILDESKRNGAVIVSEVSSGDILSMASRPNIDLNDMKSDLKKKDRRMFNKALELSYPPGSIFKIPVILAALDNGDISLDDELTCKGYDKVGKKTIKCNKLDGHGKLTIEEGLYKSCNSTFIQIGKKTGAENIIKMAKLLGFNEKVNIGIEEESSGHLPEGRKLLGPAIGNISIGQGEIEVTPMQVTNMMMIVANEGLKKDMSLVKGYVTDKGQFAKEITREDEKTVLSKDLVHQVKLVLDKVVEQGTARNINIEDIGGGGGKTGSAQAVLDGKEVTHAWFSGYFPRENPKYVITVFIEDGSSGSGVAAPMFEKIVKEIEKINPSN